MVTFDAAVTDYWGGSIDQSEAAGGGSRFTLAIDPDLPANRPVSLLRPAGGGAIATMRPEVAERLLPPARTQVTEAGFRAALTTADLTLHDPDHLFYLAEPARTELLAETPRPHTRHLTTDSAQEFAEFEAAAVAQDLDEARVELDHWLVVGAFCEDDLVCVGSAYPWRESRLADIGVLTLTPYRGKGFARAVVRAMSAQIITRGYEPQYRCQLTNTASAKAAAAAGFSAFGTWEVVATDAL